MHGALISSSELNCKAVRVGRGADQAAIPAIVVGVDQIGRDDDGNVLLVHANVVGVDENAIGGPTSVVTHPNGHLIVTQLILVIASVPVIVVLIPRGHINLHFI